MWSVGICACWGWRRSTRSPESARRIRSLPLPAAWPRDHAAEVWCADVCYIPMARGFLYLVAIMDWFSRYVLSWRLSVSLHADFCVDALEAALAHHGTPEIFNTDQGAQFPARPSPACCRGPGSRSAWTARAAAWTTSSLSGSGGRLNTRRSISKPTRLWPKPRPGSARGSASTMSNACTRR
jgi:transposase InsO family protein